MVESVRIGVIDGPPSLQGAESPILERVAPSIFVDNLFNEVEQQIRCRMASSLDVGLPATFPTKAQVEDFLSVFQRPFSSRLRVGTLEGPDLLDSGSYRGPFIWRNPEDGPTPSPPRVWYAEPDSIQLDLASQVQSIITGDLIGYLALGYYQSDHRPNGTGVARGEFPWLLDRLWARLGVAHFDWLGDGRLFRTDVELLIEPAVDPQLPGLTTVEPEYRPQGANKPVGLTMVQYSTGGTPQNIPVRLLSSLAGTDDWNQGGASFLHQYLITLD